MSTMLLAARDVSTPETKVPAVCALFWVAKILSTAFGEVFSDYLFDRFDKGVAFAVCSVVLVVALTMTIGRRRFSAFGYWLCIAIISVFGTMAADGLHFGLGVSLPLSCTLFAGFQIAVFALWWHGEGTLDMKDIVNRRREGFYWATVMGTFALGTGAGDLTAFTFHFGFFVSILVFLVPFVLALAASRQDGPRRILWFWLAYTFTRPLGASLSDWLAAPGRIGGLNLGTASVSLAFGLMFLAAFFLPPLRRRVPRSA